MPEEVKKIIILGGGTAGWMAAAALTKFLNRNDYKICLIESELIGTVGVGEATIPHIRYFNNMLGIDESEFLRSVSATYKLGIKFVNWGCLGSSYIHPFGSHGYSINGIDFHHYWLALANKAELPPFDNFSLASTMAAACKFDFPDDTDELKRSFSYAYHIDAGLYASFLRTYAEQKGAERIEGRVVQVDKSSVGKIERLILDDGKIINGDFFLDCSGFRSLLLGGQLSVGFEDWSAWLPCDRAVAIPCARVSLPTPYTCATAHEWGWQWRIPLQHRTGNGIVYSSAHVEDQHVLDRLLGNLDGDVKGKPNFLRFTAGRRKKSWEENCIAIGLSSGFLEPLESTSIYLIQQGILKFLEYFPLQHDANIELLKHAYNHDMEVEYVRIRDFLILHYHITQREDSDFWRYCKTMQLPDSLAEKIELFRSSGQVEYYENGLFMQPSWLAVYLGQGDCSGRYDCRVLRKSSDEIMQQFKQMKLYLENYTKKMRSSDEVLTEELNRNTSEKRIALASLYGS